MRSKKIPISITFHHTLRLDYNGKRVPEKIIKMNMPAPKGALIVTAMSLEYTTSKNGLMEKCTDKRFMPAGVVNVLYVWAGICFL